MISFFLSALAPIKYHYL